jgi:hypothetical protein
MFFHSVHVPTRTPGLVHEACATMENGQYASSKICPKTGRQHTRFFDTASDFVKWHYRDQGYIILKDDFRFDSEVKILQLFPTEKDITEVLNTRVIEHMDLERELLRNHDDAAAIPRKDPGTYFTGVVTR